MILIDDIEASVVKSLSGVAAEFLLALNAIDEGTDENVVLHYKQRVITVNCTDFFGKRRSELTQKEKNLFSESLEALGNDFSSEQLRETYLSKAAASLHINAEGTE